MGYFRTLKVYIIANSLCAKVSFGKLLIHLGGAQTLTFVDIYQMDKALSFANTEKQ